MGGFGGGGQQAASKQAGGSSKEFADRFAGRAADGGVAEGGVAPGGAGGAAGGIGSSATATLTSAEQRLYQYVSAHRDGASYLMAVGSWEEASPYILATGQEVMPMGGFSGTVPSPTLSAVKDLVRTGQLRFFLISGTGAGAGFGSGRGSTAATIDAWVESACKAVPATDYASTTATSTASAGVGALYACTTAA